MSLNKPIKAVLITLLAMHVGLFMPAVSIAQSTYREGSSTRQYSVYQKAGENNQYYLGEANELLMRINVWGKVRNPGQYFVPATTDLITLISVAGGPESKSRLSDVRIVRPGTDGQNNVIVVNVKKYMKTGDQRLIPDLKPEDTIVIQGSFWQLLADVATVVAQVAIAANVYYIIGVKK